MLSAGRCGAGGRCLWGPVAWRPRAPRPPFPRGVRPPVQGTQVRRRQVGTGHRAATHLKAGVGAPGTVPPGLASRSPRPRPPRRCAPRCRPRPSGARLLWREAPFAAGGSAAGTPRAGALTAASVRKPFHRARGPGLRVPLRAPRPLLCCPPARPVPARRPRHSCLCCPVPATASPVALMVISCIASQERLVSDLLECVGVQFSLHLDKFLLSFPDFFSRHLL